MAPLRARRADRRLSRRFRRRFLRRRRRGLRDDLLARRQGRQFSQFGDWGHFRRICRHRWRAPFRKRGGANELPHRVDDREGIPQAVEDRAGRGPGGHQSARAERSHVDQARLRIQHARRQQSHSGRIAPLGDLSRPAKARALASILRRHTQRLQAASARIARR